MQPFRYYSMLHIQQSIKSELAHLKQFSCPKLNKSVFQLLERKLSRPSVRSYYAYWIYQYIQETAQVEGIKINALPKKIFEVDIPFLMETAMSIMYLHNQILDRKHQVFYYDAINKNLLGANLLKDILYDYVATNFTPALASTINQYLRKIFRAVDIGQSLEKNYNTYAAYRKDQAMISINPEIDNWIQFANAQQIINSLQTEFPAKKNYIKLYFSKIFLTCTSLFVYFTQLILALTAYQGKHQENLVNFARVHGIMRQLINDNTDFVKCKKGTTTKASEDVLSDLQQGNITLPLIFHLSLHEGESLVKSYLKTGNPDYLNAPKILNEMILSKALFKSMKVGRILASSRGSRPYLHSSISSESYLSNLNSIAFNNRFYHQIFERRNHLEKIKKRKIHLILS